MAYTDSTAIASLLGITLTAGQATRAGVAAAAATDFIDKALDRSWLSYTGTPLSVADERHTVRGNRIWLYHPPVAAISAVSSRLRYAGATVYAVDQSYQYELIEPLVGEVVFSPTYEGQRIEVDYTSRETVPALITEFAAQLAAGMLSLALGGASATAAAAAGVKSYSLWGGDLRVEYGDTQTDEAGSSPLSSRLPVLWADIERLYSRRLVVA